MTSLSTLTVKSGSSIKWYGALCPEEIYRADDVSELLRHGKSIGILSDGFARQCWSGILKSNDTADAVDVAIKKLMVAFDSLSAPGYSFRVADTPHGRFWGWWPDAG